MRYRYFVDFRHGISVFANFSYGIVVLGTPQCPPHLKLGMKRHIYWPAFHVILAARSEISTWSNVLSPTPSVINLSCLEPFG